MSVLDRFKDTEKYPRQMRELGMLIILNRRQNPGIFLKTFMLIDVDGSVNPPSYLMLNTHKKNLVTVEN